MMYKVEKMRFGFNDIGEDFVVFDIRDETYHVMNESAKDLINILMAHETCDLECVINNFVKIYDVDENIKMEVKQDIKELLNKFIEIGLVKAE